ncbi:hypothetical protein [Bacillus cereus]|uniref:hypothetical protein n=1 Tax=Bacillus cereus TaxID=1396 RepID=UPI0039C075DC
MNNTGELTRVNGIAKGYGNQFSEIIRGMERFESQMAVASELAKRFENQFSGVTIGMKSIGSQMAVASELARKFENQFSGVTRGMKNIGNQMAVANELAKNYEKQALGVNALLKGMGYDNKSAVKEKDFKKQIAGVNKRLKKISIPSSENVEEIGVVANTIVAGSIEEMDSKKSKLYYDELSEAINQANVGEILEQEEVKVINVISENKYKTLCYKVTVSFLMILMSSTLQIEEIEKVMMYVGFLLTALGTWNGFDSEPTIVEHHHHHHYHNKDE